MWKFYPPKLLRSAVYGDCLLSSGEQSPTLVQILFPPLIWISLGQEFPAKSLAGPTNTNHATGWTNSSCHWNRIKLLGASLIDIRKSFVNPPSFPRKVCYIVLGLHAVVWKAVPFVKNEKKNTNKWGWKSSPKWKQSILETRILPLNQFRSKVSPWLQYRIFIIIFWGSPNYYDH